MLTRLQAINQILVAVGEQVILVEVAGAGDYANAGAVLDAETIKVLAKGWDFNTDNGWKTGPDSDGHVLIPASVLHVASSDPNRNIVQRGDRLYDVDRKSDEFDADLEVNLIRSFAFEDCPYHVQREVVGRAIKAYQRSYVGSSQLDQFAQEEQYEAQGDARDAESVIDDFNMLDNPDLYYLRRRVHRRLV
ncbi:hypothetical protein [Xylophilus sp.]|uniref:hypothetical protein n=1 Tax=Xylophilus sp. TaxID=2653893 RepID=UPI0013B704FC|nr:hypothetical protein [Xylophilus sp.]KAF1049331.1 MAG: hypothetical protein GAK38_00787 [Xylophilus sp.]